MRFLLSISLLFLLTACDRKAVQSETNDSVTIVSSDDSLMNQAIERARSTLPFFWERFQSRPEGTERFNLKVRISDGDQVEHIWCSDIINSQGRISGKISNYPEFVHNVKVWQRIDIDPNSISDWMYYDQGKIIGNYTLRALLPHMAKEEAKELEGLLGDLPDNP